MNTIPIHTRVNFLLRKGRKEGKIVAVKEKRVK
jgi:hypothetical protein